MVSWLYYVSTVTVSSLTACGIGVFVCRLTADFCLTGRKLDSERGKKVEEENERWVDTVSRAANIFATLIFLFTLNTISHLQHRHPFPLHVRFLVIYTHSLLFFWISPRTLKPSLLTHILPCCNIQTHMLITASLSPCGWSPSASPTASRCQWACSHHT